MLSKWPKKYYALAFAIVCAVCLTWWLASTGRWQAVAGKSDTPTPSQSGTPTYAPPKATNCKDAVNECTTNFVKYIPSEYEKTWYDNIQAWQFSVCPNMRNQLAQADKWVELSTTHPADNAWPPEVFSYFQFTDSCTQKEVKVAIEPLAGITRHPWYCTRGGNYIVDKSYLLLDCRTYVNNTRAFYFDLGASTWTTGAGGASQSWFYSTYKNCGINFVEFYMWEAAPVAAEAAWRELPAEIKPHYHWFNIPAVTDKAAGDNPMNMIRSLVRKEDFLLLKIDIDNTPVETEFINQLLADPALLSLVDDFYFEHHVNVAEMVGSWGTGGISTYLNETYKIFRQFREAGVRAHSWV